MQVGPLILNPNLKPATLFRSWDEGLWFRVFVPVSEVLRALWRLEASENLLLMARVYRVYGVWRADRLCRAYGVCRARASRG